METGAEAKAKRGPKACIQRQMQPIITPATRTRDLEEAAVHLMVSPLGFVSSLIYSTQACKAALWDTAGHSNIQRALYEEATASDRRGEATFGYAFSDTAAGHMYLGTLQDSGSLAALNSLLTQVKSGTAL
eukprot:scaffold616_cov52-Prasinocladus_malaysianus.AAC.1